MTAKSLIQLLRSWQTFARQNNYPAPPLYHGNDVQIKRIIEDSRLVKSADAFVARVRPYSDGHPFIPQAIAQGASLIIAQQPPPDDLPPEVSWWHVENSALVLSWLAAAWHNFPGNELTVVGVTGTDGKTSITNLVYEILLAAGYNTGMISTIKAVIGTQEEPTGLHVTTPQAPQTQALLRRMVSDGMTHCVLEVTSMGLAEHRADTAFFDVGAVSNITHEHIDYHGSYEAYLRDKGRLFQLATQTILNHDDHSFEALHAIAPDALTYGIDQPATIQATQIVYSAEETRFDLQIDGAAPLPIVSKLVGKFNVANMACAAAVATALQIDPRYIQQGFAQVEIISGRMERISAGQECLVIVDFAHTPNALHKAIEAARGMTEGRIITVFGSAGRRDVQKRRLMAEVSAAQADLTILTAEDPRNEPLDEILQMMAEGALSQGGVEGETFWRIPDRGRAIYHAMMVADSADLILICGKGHEQSMCFGTTEYNWDDRNATHAVLNAFLNDTLPPDLGLPTY